jgi:hypothetical protein
MKHVVFLLLLIAALGSQAQKAPITRVYILTGKIDKYPVTFILHRINEDFFGGYFYQSSASPIDITGKIDKNGFLKLSHLGHDEKDNENIDGVFKDTSFSGTWQSKGKVLSFRVTQQNDASALQFDYIWTEGTKKLKDKPEHMSHIEGLSYDGRSVWPTAQSNHPAKQVIQQAIRESFGAKTGSEEIGKILVREKNEFLSVIEDSVVTYELSNAVDIAYIDDRLLSFASSNSTYSGGAHGLYGTSYFNVDLKNNRQLKLADVLDSAAAASAVGKLLEKAFKKDFPFDEGESIKDVLLVEKITMGDNFMLTGKGITFNYVPYEIAAYAFGQIALYISYKDLQPYLKPGFKKLMGL